MTNVPARCLLVVLLVTSLTASFDARQGPPRSQSPTRVRLSTAEVAKRSSPAVVTITTSSGQGSGVILDSSGLIVTNLHVVRGQKQASVKLMNGDVFDDIQVIDVDERKDILLLKIKGADLSAVVAGNSEQVQVGEKVILIGSPRGLDRTVSDGVVSAVRDSGEGYRLIQTTAAASPGSSGGGMFNEYGDLIGITSSKLTNGENINFAIPINYIKGLVASGGVAGQNRGTLADLAIRFPESPTGTTSPQAVSQNANNGAPANAARMVALLEASGIRYEKNGDSSWLTSFKGERGDVITVHISLYGELAVSQSTVVENAKLNQEQLVRLMKLNFDTDLAKVTIDGNDDLTAVNEAEIRLLDGEGLKTVVTAVAVLADDAAGFLKGTANPTESASELRAPRATASNSTLDLLQRHASVLYDRKEWTPETTTEPGISQFSHSSGEIWARVIAERIEIPLANMEEIALTNARTLDPNVRVIRRGTRTVNSVKMSFLEFEAMSTGIRFTFLGHYYSDTSGTVQIIGWSPSNLLNEHRPTIERFVAGFQVVVR